MSRNAGGAKRKSKQHASNHSLRRSTEEGACPVPRNKLLSFVADVAGVGERNRAVLRMLLDSNSCVLAKKHVYESMAFSASSEGCRKIHCPSQAVENGLQPSPARDTSTAEPALDVRVAGDCALIQGEQHAQGDAQGDVQGDAMNSSETAISQIDSHTDVFDQADLPLRVENVGSHELLHISKLLGGDSNFDCLYLVVNQPLDCDTRNAAVMAAMLVLLSSFRTCLSLETVDITFQVPVEEARQSAMGAVMPIAQVVLTELQRAVVRDCLWLRGCRFRRPQQGRSADNDTREVCEQWTAQRGEQVAAVRTALLMAYHSRLGASSLLKNLPNEVMRLLLDKSAPIKFELCLQL